ncbi:MAG: hypothetical protein QG602_1909 [Verrucomicrobiota bacterium]|nr:hypothetical protein [Verrucomicrobiota bacterium]
MTRAWADATAGLAEDAGWTTSSVRSGVATAGTRVSRPPMRVRWTELPGSPTVRAQAVRLGLVLAFAVALARFWSPFYGFTALLQADRVTAENLPACLQDAPVFIHESVGRYDGAYYAQIATDPLLRDPDLAVAVDAPGYRGRRILLSALAWVAAGGESVAAVQAYAWMNLGFWFLLAAIMALLLPAAGGWRATAAWCGVMLAGGTLGSVRLALTDLAAMLLLAGGLLLVERGRTRLAAGCLGLAGLARETALLGAAMFWPAAQRKPTTLARAAALVALAVLPLAAWWSYVHLTAGSSDAGSRNFALPLAGWLEKWTELWRLSGTERNHGLVFRGWLDCVALSVQAVFLLKYRDPANPWWRVGSAFVVLGSVLGTSVWEGLPGAYARVLLPVTLCFNVLAARRRAAVLWLLLGNLSVVGGIWSIIEMPGTPHQLTDARKGEQHYVLETDARWSVAEWNSKYRWAWCAEAGGLSVRVWPHRPAVRLELELRGVTPRDAQVLHGGRVVWSGRVGDRPAWISLPELPLERGRLDLELRSPEPARAEGQDNTARRIGLACFGARVVE